MARSKKAVTEETLAVDSSQFDAADIDITGKLGEAFERVITNQYGYARAPKPYITPFGIRHLDALLGGGIVSSAPVVLSSTPETGKSTLAFEFASIFQTIYPNSIVVYIDVEAAGNMTSINQNFSRVKSFNIDENRFRYEPILIDVMGLFQMIETLVDIKKQFEAKLQKEFRILLIWDSIAATPCSKMADVEDYNKIIGVKARQLSFCIEKYAPVFAHNRITFMTIDQVRANLQIDGPYVAKEKSVGVWNDFKAASSIASLNHKTAQWLFLSKRAQITPDDGMGINGWYLNLYTEKNKFAPSQESVTCVFDKRTGLHKFWSEFTFLSEITRSEKKYYKDESKLPYPLSIKKSGNQVHLEFIEPTSGTCQYKSENFFRKNAYNMYQEDENFRNAFDHIMDIAVVQRITEGLFRMTSSDKEIVLTDEDSVIPPINEPQNTESLQEDNVYGDFNNTTFSDVASEAKVEEVEADYKSAFDEE